jgi:hypothetical protein
MAIWWGEPRRRECLNRVPFSRVLGNLIERRQLATGRSAVGTKSLHVQVHVACIEDSGRTVFLIEREPDGRPFCRFSSGAAGCTQPQLCVDEATINGLSAWGAPKPPPMPSIRASILPQLDKSLAVAKRGMQ